MGDLLKNKFTKKTIDLKEIPDSLKVTIDEISSEFGEKRNFRSNLTHVVRILQRSGKSGDPRKAGRFSVGHVLCGTAFSHEFNHPTEDRPAWDFGREVA